MSIHDWSKAPDWAKAAWKNYRDETVWVQFDQPCTASFDGYETRPEPEEKPKTLHDWSKAPEWAVAAYPDLEGKTMWVCFRFTEQTAASGYEERPEPAETCEEQEAWDQLEAAKRKLFEQRMEEAHKASEHPQKSHARQMVGSALNLQEGGGHYKDMAIQPVEYIHKNGLGFIEGAVIKYVSRHKAKGGAEDLRKAAHFIELLLELEYGQHN